jgi:hypothetical protein
MPWVALRRTSPSRVAASSLVIRSTRPRMSCSASSSYHRSVASDSPVCQRFFWLSCIE